MSKLINNSICRSCLSKKEQLINPFTEYDSMNNLNYANKYYFSTNILINKTDSLPKMLCQDCIFELQIAYQFQHRAKQSNDALLNCLNGNNKIIKNLVLINDNLPMRLEAENGYRVISILPLSNAPETSSKCDWKRNDDINLKKTDNNEYVINKNNPTYTVINDEEESKYSALEIIENEELTFNCVKCGDSFDNKDLLDGHINQNHTSRNTHNENLSNEVELEHIKEEDNSLKENFLCSLCGATFADQTILDDHFRSTHQDEREGVKEDITESDVIDSVKKILKIPKYLCSTCGKNFTTNQRLQIHTYTHTGERNYDCDFCSKKFPTEFRLRSHRRTHTGERPYECSICKLRFAQASALKCHKRVHTGEKPYECRYCSRRFSQNTILKTHLTLHTGKTIQCPDCDKKFSRSSYLILHRREHTGEKPYACDRCPKRYKQKSHLDRHMDTHSGVKYKCTICSKEYSKQYSLKMHMFTHSNEKPFNCSHCTATFTRSDSFRNHLRLRHTKVNE